MDNHTRYLFMINPSSGKASLAKKRDLVAQVSEPLTSRVVVSESEEHAAQVAGEAMRAGETVVACGGDGFQNIVAQQAVKTGGVMCVLPLGRGNDFAASLGVRTPKDTAQAIEGGLVHNARYVNVAFSGYSRISLTCAGVGLLSEATYRASRLPVLRGKLLYTVAALLSLVRLKCHTYRVTLDDVVLREEFLILVGAASGYTGGGIHIAPEAQSDPDRLNVLFAKSAGRLATINLLVKALTGRHLAHPKVKSSFHARCQVESETDDSQALLVYGDGEYLGDLPASLQLGDRPLRVLVPNKLG